MESKDKKLTDYIALNRRNFIKLIVGGAVGINLTPLPWKFTDDIAIWTQNWPWVPVPPVGEFSHVPSVCTLCPGGCGIEVRKVDERAIKIEGRTDYPVNPGGLCPLGASGLQLLYNENIRFTGPMKRVGPRGSGQYIDITWEEALQEVAHRIVDLRKQGKPDALAAINGFSQRSTMHLVIKRFIEALGSPNNVGIPTAEDTYMTVNRLMAGSAGPMAYDLENADFILSFGCGLIEGWGSPGRMINAWGLWHSENPKYKKTKIVQIDCRASNTASKADQWVVVKPGTEGALALGLAHVMILKGIYDKTFIENHGFGFEDWTSEDGNRRQGFKNLVLNKYSPQKVSEITGLEAGAVISLGEAFAGAKAPLALFGKGKGQCNGSLFEGMAIQALNAMVGNINRPGGVLIHDPIPEDLGPQGEGDDITRKGLKNPRIDHAGGNAYPFTGSMINNLAWAVTEGSGSSPIDTLLIFSSNPAYTLPDGGLFKSALEKIPFIISFSPYKDDTALFADLILPDHTSLEKREDIVWPTGLQYPLYGLSQPVTAPLYNTRHSGDVIIELAKMLGGAVGSAFPWNHFEQALQSRVKGLFESGPGRTRYNRSCPVWENLSHQGDLKADYRSFEDLWEKLKTGGLWYRPSLQYGIWEGLFKTPTGRFEFFSTALEAAFRQTAPGGTAPGALLKEAGVAAEGDEAYMPHYEPVKSSYAPQGYPLLLMPYELINVSTGWLPNPHFMNKTLLDHQLVKNESFAEINPQTASEHNLMEGDRIILESPKGRLNVRVHLFEGAMPGVVFLPLGLGHRAYDEYQRNKGVNPNAIITPDRDPLSGLTAWWNTRVKIAKA